ncbi:hypothetical protein [Embleya sp. AB8]|uniref:hypothetical protein n=1 Tax=Embleya sp. AB8 TaxID=3156304 RepID=UPI003C74B6C2
MCVVLLAVLGLCAQPAAAAPRDSGAAVDRVVLIGVPGLGWGDVDPKVTPALAAFTEHASSAALVVRTVRKSTCPGDGWLTLGAGARASGGCSGGPAPQQAADGSWSVPGMERIAGVNKDTAYAPPLGALAHAVAGSGRCVTAVGPGAALASADPAGRLPGGYLPDAGSVGAEELARCALTLVDLGALPPTGAARTARLAEADAAVGRIVAALPPRTMAVVAGVGDDGSIPGLRLFAARAPGLESGLLAADSTRRDGLIQLTDVAPTLLARLGVATPPGVIGAAAHRVAGPSGAAAVERLARLDDAAQQARLVRERYQFSTWLTWTPVVLFGAAGAVGMLLRRRGRQVRALRRGVQAVAIVAACVPVGTFLANLAPWEESATPKTVLLGWTAAWTVAIAAVALLGPWRRIAYGPAAVAGGVTTAVLALDITTGGTLQLNALLGLSPLVGGRFYGFGNITWPLYATGLLFAVAWPAGRLIAADRRRAGILLAAGTGAAGVLIAGWPGLGNKFGAMLAMVPGVIVLTLLLAGVRVTWTRLTLTALAAALTAAAVACADWARPAEHRSHLGTFVQQVLDGEAGDVLHRKISTNLSTFHWPGGIILPIAFVALFVAITSPTRLRAHALAQAYQTAPWTRPALLAIWTTAVAGYATNDSGLQVPASALVLAIPLAVAVAVAPPPTGTPEPKSPDPTTGNQTPERIPEPT